MTNTKEILTIIKSLPPNIDQIRLAFPQADFSHAVFCYAPFLYNPHDEHVDDYLLAHEMIHAIQQTLSSSSTPTPELWWNRYLKDKDFRLSQEVEAYRTQYKSITNFVRDREALSRFLTILATDLASPLYGSLCSLSEARALIRNTP